MIQKLLPKKITLVSETKTIPPGLGDMAAQAGIFDLLCRPEAVGIKKASDLISPLSAGLSLLKSKPDVFKLIPISNGAGSYEYLVSWIQDYLKICIANPDSAPKVSLWPS